MLDCQLDQHGNPPPPKNHKQQSSSRMPAIISPCQANEIAKLKAQDKTGPDPWFVRKFAVGIVAALFVYSYYVYVARLCVPMLRLDSNRLGGRAQGLAYIVVCNVLFVMTLWSYITVTTTSPGYARDYVPQTDPPPEDAEYITVAGPPFSPRPHTTEEDLRSDLDLDDDEGEETLEMSEQRRRSSVMSTASRRSGGVVAEEDAIAETAPSAGAVGPSLASTLLPPLSATTSIPHTSAPLPSSPVDDSVSPGRLLDAEIDAAAERERERDRCQSTSSTVAASSTVTFPPQAHLLSSQHPRKLSSTPSSSFPLPLPSGARPSSDSATPSYLHFPEPDPDWEPVVQLKVERVPQKVPVLTEQYRYDTREGLLRPVRSHRCRHCAKVVLKMDHHCPWIGTCVGARNYKYFYNFLQCSSFYTLFLFLTLLISLILPLSSPPPSSSSSSTTPYRYPRVDGHLIAIIAISFLFFLFTGSLFAAHTSLVLRNMTTIEEIGMNRIKQRERASLRQVYGFWGWRAKRANQKAWDVQWGGHGREGNLWWLGSRRKNWESVMGRGKLGWFLPIPPSPRQETPGLHYEPNPRFSKEGIWRPRREWPKELR